MAITTIHPITATLGRSIAYICNPDKTDGQILISTHACSQETAEYDFRFSLSKTRQPGKRVAYHLIQAFAPGEVEYEEAHQIREELAHRYLQGRYSYVLATHTDRDYVHNHLIFCAADNIHHRKFISTRKSYCQLRRLNDQLCLEHGLSVIGVNVETSINTSINNSSTRRPSSWKQRIRSDIDDTIQCATDYEHFLQILKSKSYEIKGESTSDSSLKYISFKPQGKERFVRGSEKSLGKEYTKERILERIAFAQKQRSLLPNVKRRPAPSSQSAEMMHVTANDPVMRTNISENDYQAFISNALLSVRSISAEKLLKKRKRLLLNNHSALSHAALIDTSQARFQTSPGLRTWAERQNLKTAASIYASMDASRSGELHIQELTKSISQLQSSIAETDKNLRCLAEAIKYAEQYEATSAIADGYEKAKDKEMYLHMHETDLLLHNGAKQYLMNHKLLDQKNEKSLSDSISVTSVPGLAEQLREQYDSLKNQRNVLSNELKLLKTEKTEEVKKYDALRSYLNNEKPPKTAKQVKQVNDL